MTGERDDRFTLFDLRVVVVKGDAPMVCDHPEGAYFDVFGEMIVFPEGQRPAFPMYSLAAILPLLPAKQRPTAATADCCCCVVASATCVDCVAVVTGRLAVADCGAAADESETSDWTA